MIRDPGEPAFDEADVTWLSGLCEYAAIATRNAQAYQQSAQATSMPEETLSGPRQELEQLASELRATSEQVERLMALLDDRTRQWSGSFSASSRPKAESAQVWRHTLTNDG